MRTSQPPSEILSALMRTPAIVRSTLDGAPQAWLGCDEGPGTWTPHQVLAHMVNAEHTNWIPRMRSIVDTVEEVPFPAFDRHAHLNGKLGDIQVLCDVFDSSRRQNIRTAEPIVSETGNLDRRGIHPEFGLVTLRQLLATWLVHDLTHLTQITRTITLRYRHDVGPWAAYIRALRESSPA
jgi:hypothetical protein